MDLLSVLSELAVDGLDAMFGGAEEPAEWTGPRLACKALRSLVGQHTVRSRVRVHIQGPEVDAWPVGNLAGVGKRCRWIEVLPASGSDMMKTGDGRSPYAAVERLDMRLPSVQIKTAAALAYSMGFTGVRHLSLGACCPEWTAPAMEPVYEQMAVAMPLLQVLELPFTSCIKGIEVLKELTTVRAVPVGNTYASNQLLMCDTHSLLQLQHLQTLELCLTGYGPQRFDADDRRVDVGNVLAGDEALLEQIDEPRIREQMYALRLLAGSAPKCLTNIKVVALACATSATSCVTNDIRIGLLEGQVQTVTVSSVYGWCLSLNILAAALLPVVLSQKSGKLRTFRTDNFFLRYESLDKTPSNYFRLLKDNTGPESPLRRLLAACADVRRVSTIYLSDPFCSGAPLPDAVTALHNIASMFGSMPTCVAFHDPKKDFVRQLYLMGGDHDHVVVPPSALLRVTRRLHVTVTKAITNLLLFGARFHCGQPMPVWALAWRRFWTKGLQLMWDKFHLLPQAVSHEVDFLLKLARIHQVVSTR